MTGGGADMPATYDPIASITLASTAASYTFSSIPSTYTDLILVINATTSSNTNLQLGFNGDSTAANYSQTYLYGDGTSAGSGRDSAYYDRIFAGNIKTAAGNKIIQVMSYSNTSVYKTVLMRTNNPGTDVTVAVGLFASTSAISSVELVPGANFAAGSTFSLYGIKAA